MCRDRTSQCSFWYLVPRKGCDFATLPHLLTQICRDLDWLGYKKVCFRSDGEPAIVSLLTQVKKQWTGEIVPEKAAEGDSQSNGSAECGVGLMKVLVRTLKLDLEGKLGSEILETHNGMT